MMLDIVTKGSTDRAVLLRIVDAGTGLPASGLVFNSAGMDLWYRREGAAKVSITEVTLLALTDAHSDGGFLEVSNGVYRLDLPDAAFATGANHVDIGGTVTGYVVLGGRVRLVDYNPEDGTALGLTAMPVQAASVRTAVGLASANLDTQLTAIDDFLDTEVAAIKAKTDQLTFSTANQVDARVLTNSDKTHV